MSSARIAGVCAVVIFGLLLGATIFVTRGPNKVVEPTNGVTAGGATDNPAGSAALSELKARTDLQRWPGQTAHAPSTSLALGPPASAPPPNANTLVREWQADKGANRDILDQAQLRRGIATIPGDERGVLMQPQGRTWRDLHNDKLAYGGAVYVLGVSLLIALFLAWRGRIRVAEGMSGEGVERFSAFERANHWMTAASFILMALTGLIILYGNGLVRPWLGARPYAELARLSAWSHMTLAVPFLIGVIVMIALWLRQNLLERLDWDWLRQGGGFLRSDGHNPPARKFNAGQKLVFWGVALGGLALGVTGVALMFPFFWAGYTGMQIAQSLHAGLALLMIGLIIGHIYIGTIGMEGAFGAMWSGVVDRNWAKEHHSLWYRSLHDPAGARAGWRRASVASAVGSLAAGVVVAILLAVAIGGLYDKAAISSANKTNPAVHLGGDTDTTATMAGLPNRQR